MENDCQNRGYVLDGYPRNYKDCLKIFTKRKPVFNEDGEEEPQEESEEEAEEGDEGDVDPTALDDIREREIEELITPNHIMNLEGDDDFLCDRIKGLPEE